MRPFAVSVLIGLLVVITGCGGATRPVLVDFDASQNRTLYRTPSIRIPIESRDSGYGSQFNQLRMSLRATCSGQDCRPSLATLTLSTGGTSDLYLGDRTLVIKTREEQFEWPDPQGERGNRPERIVGMVVRVEISVSQLRTVALSERVNGTIGSVQLEFDERSQRRIRDFLRRMGVELPAEEA